MNGRSLVRSMVWTRQRRSPQRGMAAGPLQARAVARRTNCGPRCRAGRRRVVWFGADEEPQSKPPAGCRRYYARPRAFERMAKDAVLVDWRAYETTIGAFPGALDPKPRMRGRFSPRPRDETRSALRRARLRSCTARAPIVASLPGDSGAWRRRRKADAPSVFRRVPRRLAWPTWTRDWAKGFAGARCGEGFAVRSHGGIRGALERTAQAAAGGGAAARAIGGRRRDGGRARAALRRATSSRVVATASTKPFYSSQRRPAPSDRRRPHSKSRPAATPTPAPAPLAGAQRNGRRSDTAASPAAGAPSGSVAGGVAQVALTVADVYQDVEEEEE